MGQNSSSLATVTRQQLTSKNKIRPNRPIFIFWGWRWIFWGWGGGGGTPLTPPKNIEDVEQFQTWTIRGTPCYRHRVGGLRVGRFGE